MGGGPTGVELAAEMHDYIKEDLAELFPTLKVLLFAVVRNYTCHNRCMPLVWYAASALETSAVLTGTARILVCTPTVSLGHCMFSCEAVASTITMSEAACACGLLCIM